MIYLKRILQVAFLGLVFSLVACDQAAKETSAPTTVTELASIQPLSADERNAYAKQLADTLADPVARSEMIVKIMGSTAREDTHAFMKFHVYGVDLKKNIIPFFTMNNYIVQKWTPVERGDYALKHYEVAYYSEFDSTEPINQWVNPITGEEITIPHFILGPISRQYTPDGIIAPGIAPNPLNISMIGDRIFIPTQSIDEMADVFLPEEEWGVYASGSNTYWDSMLTYSADVRDVFDPAKKRAHAEIHMQNMVSWAPYLRMGKIPGRTMVRAFGQHISGYDELPADIRANLEKYTPEIFNTEEWETMRFDSVELFIDLQKQKANGELKLERSVAAPS